MIKRRCACYDVNLIPRRVLSDVLGVVDMSMLENDQYLRPDSSAMTLFFVLNYLISYRIKTGKGKKLCKCKEK